LKTFHIHIEGIVQGVGFRPFVYKFCLSHNLKGWVNNTNDGVHVHINAAKEKTEKLLEELIEKAPKLSVITSANIEEVDFVEYNSFEIVHSSTDEETKLLLTPDFAMCEDCANELYLENNSRYLYPFVTCTNCGPRYSIINSLPYDRETTTMKPFKMCYSCRGEYDDPMDRRYYSQTNSCLECPIELSLYENGKIKNNFTDLNYIISKWNQGKIIAIKGIGGYILTCDATNKEVISRLRDLKHRPSKPFALMYQNIQELEKDVELKEVDKKEFQSYSAPIILLKIKEKLKTPLAINEIAPNLNNIGVMLPYTPLYRLLLDKFQKPIIATSGNISNSTIVYQDKVAYKELSKIADIIISNNRDIVIPQDDSVVRFSNYDSKKIIIRRSRGLAPSYINADFDFPEISVLAMGAMLKSSFTLLNQKNIYISQFLGNTDNYDAENNYKHTLNHFINLFKPKINTILIDKHPNYFSSIYGKELAIEKGIETIEVQHHIAHFYAVLGENNLLKYKEKVLGVIWDGTGLGDDGNIWGGEFFEYDQNTVKRVFHLDEFPFILGDKLPKEPRISALVMTNDLKNDIIKDKFSKTEWSIYNNLLQGKNLLKSTSVGRLFDAVASIVLEIDKQSFEGEAAMQLESKAVNYFQNNKFSLDISYLNETKLPNNLIKHILKQVFFDLEINNDVAFISARFHASLAHYIYLVAKKQEIQKVAFSGGVFQNQLLLDLISNFLSEEFDLFFHKKLSPNDECISFGQLVYFNSNK